MRLNTYITYKKTYPPDIQKDLVFRAKNTNIIDLWCYNEDDAIVDISGSEIYFMVKDSPSQADTSAKLNKKITILTNPTVGNAEIELTSEDTSALLGSYIYQIKIKYSSKWYTVAEGLICFRQNIITRES